MSVTHRRGRGRCIGAAEVRRAEAAAALRGRTERRARRAVAARIVSKGSHEGGAHRRLAARSLDAVVVVGVSGEAGQHHFPRTKTRTQQRALRTEAVRAEPRNSAASRSAGAAARLSAVSIRPALADAAVDGEQSADWIRDEPVPSAHTIPIGGIGGQRARRDPCRHACGKSRVWQVARAAVARLLVHSARGVGRTGAAASTAAVITADLPVALRRTTAFSCDSRSAAALRARARAAAGD